MTEPSTPDEVDARARSEHLSELADRAARARYGRREPSWLVERDDDDGLRMLGHGLDDE
jgi:hypothetical protein